MMHYTDHSSPISKQYRATRLTASLLSLLLGALGIVFLFLALRAASVVSASQREDALNSSIYQTSDSAVAAGVTSAVNVTKTVESPHPATGEVVPFCSGIGGLDPRSLDIVLALDVSGSMTNTIGDGMTRLEAAQTAAIAFVNLLSGTDRAAVVPYSTDAYLAQPLTTTKSIITETISGLAATGYTNIGDGINVSHQELITSSRYMSDTIKAIILLSDGQANLPVDEATAKEYARQQASAVVSDNIKIYTIGFGSEADHGLLQEIATISGGRYFSATTSDALNAIYQALGTRAGCYYLPIVARNWTPPGIVNGNFEYGWTGWTHGGELAQTITAMNPHSDNFSALLGDPAYVCQNGVPVGSAWMEQTVVVPDTSPRLSFWYNIVTQDKNPTPDDTFDSFNVKVNGKVRFRMANMTGTYGCASLTDLGWLSGTIDLTANRGQQITIRFENRNWPDGWYNTWTYVDDVQFTP